MMKTQSARKTAHHSKADLPDGFYSTKLNLYGVKTSWGEASCEHEAELGLDDQDGPTLAEEFAFGVHHYG